MNATRICAHRGVKVCRQTDIVLAEMCHDLVVPDAGRLRFQERIVVLDSATVPNSFVYPA